MKANSNFPDIDHIAIIFNPISTGDAPKLAEKLADSISNDKAIKLNATLTPTQHAGHAEELAKKISLKYARPLIISVSGDGGYNEVVNGAMNAKLRSKDAAPVVAVVGAGNANDHRRVMRDDPLMKLIKVNQPKAMDLLRITSSSGKERFDRFAHSYIGFGISPQVALRLNRHELNKFRELQIAVKTFFTFEPFVYQMDSKKHVCDSLVFANINEMAKVLKFKDEANVRDGKFEVIEFAHKNRLQLLWRFIFTATSGLDNPPSYSSYSFELPNASDMQLDGEVDKLPARSKVTVKSVARAIDALY